MVPIMGFYYLKTAPRKQFEAFEWYPEQTEFPSWFTNKDYEQLKNSDFIKRPGRYYVIRTFDNEWIVSDYDRFQNTYEPVPIMELLEVQHKVGLYDLMTIPADVFEKLEKEDLARAMVEKLMNYQNFVYFESSRNNLTGVVTLTMRIKVVALNNIDQKEKEQHV
jgi:hypothetical protein